MRLRCKIGLHSGTIEPAHAIERGIEARCALVCSHCGAVVE